MMTQTTSAMLRFTQLDGEDFPLPPEIVARCNGHNGKHLTLVTRNSKPVNVRLEKRGQSFYISKGWKKFVELTDLRVGQCVRFSVSSPSTLDLLILDKHGTSLAIPPSKRDLKLKSKRSTHQDSKGHPSNTDPGPSRIINRRVTKSGQLITHAVTLDCVPLLVLIEFQHVQLASRHATTSFNHTARISHLFMA
ncbi:B3 domain-containing protein Os10g0323000-like isoform X3 [Oryza glaberrima]|nr:B3 domain-containing protein Os10g0323000-like isoform X3 [Oryza glaberrima]